MDADSETKSENDRIEENIMEIKNLTEKPPKVFSSPFKKRRGSVGEDGSNYQRHGILTTLNDDCISITDSTIIKGDRPITSNDHHKTISHKP